MMSKHEIQTRVSDAIEESERAREKYIAALKVKKVAMVEAKECLKEWKRANIQLSRLQGKAMEAELEEGFVEDEANA